jgi:hypothetical protein
MTRRILVLLGAVSLGFLALWHPWDKWLYRGDGRFSDRTECRRPRYLIRLNRIAISKTGLHQFHFRAVPREKPALMLDVDRRTVRDDEELKSLQTAIEVALVDGHGNDLPRE